MIMVMTALERSDSSVTANSALNENARYTPPARISACSAATAAASVGVKAPL